MTWSWFTFWLILHVLAVFVAFGPTFGYPFIAALGQRHPEHAGFAVEAIDTIERRLALPLAVIVPFLGVALIYTAHINLWQSEWLVIAIVLYTVAFFYSILVQNPTSARMLRALRAMPPGPPPPGAQPPPEIQALGRKLQMGGIFLTVLLVAIIVLMVWKPGNCVGTC